MHIIGSGLMRRGFTLIELSVVVTIIALILAGGMATLVAGTQQSQYNATVATMNTIEDALVKYSVAYNRLPCPSGLTYTPTSIYYGAEATPGTNACNTTAATPPAANFSSTAGTTEGGVPTVALHLPDSYMYDGWGRRIRYAVDPTVTNINYCLSANSTATSAVVGSYSYTNCLTGTTTCNTTGGLCVGTNANGALPPPVGGPLPSGLGATVYDYSGNTRTNNAAYVLLSHGNNGHGAYNAAGTQTNANTTNSFEQANCHCNASATNNASYLATYYELAPTGIGLAAFDDIVTFKEPWQLRSSNSLAANPGYIFVANSGTNNILQYTANTQAWTVYAATASVDGGVSVAACNGSIICPSGNLGNLYIGVQGFGAIYKHLFSQNTATATSFVSGLTAPKATYVDSNGNLWTNTTTTLKGYNSTPTVISTNSTGSLSATPNLYVDANRNIWVADYDNDEVKYYNNTTATWTTNGAAGYAGEGTAGTCTTSTAASAPLGQFACPKGIYMDAAGYVWITELKNNRVQKCSAANGVLSNCVAYGLNCQTSSVPACTAAPTPVTTTTPLMYNYGFNGPKGIAGDTFGNIWVLDTGNNRILEYNATLGTWGPMANYYEALSSGVPASQTAFSNPFMISVVR